MSHVLMIAEESQALGGLLDGLMQSGFTCSNTTNNSYYSSYC